MQIRVDLLAQPLVLFDGGFRVDALGFFDQRADDKDLASLCDLVTDEGVRALALAWFKPLGFDFLPTRRHLVDDRVIKVPGKSLAPGSAGSVSRS